MPFHDDIYGGRQNTLADGASLWIGAGQTAANARLAAKFVDFMLKPEMQIEMVRAYGQMPLTAAARQAASSDLLKTGGDVLKVAFDSTMGKGSTPSVRVANIDPVRIIANEELEAAWADQKPPKAALDTAVSRGNAILSAKPDLKKAQPF
jgi:sn-glycerol 3-phosphate transport system substrate-binding protein